MNGHFHFDLEQCEHIVYPVPYVPLVLFCCRNNIHAVVASQCLKAGVTFIGPPPGAIVTMGSKAYAFKFISDMDRHGQNIFHNIMFASS